MFVFKIVNMGHVRIEILHFSRITYKKVGKITTERLISIKKCDKIILNKRKER